MRIAIAAGAAAVLVAGVAVAGASAAGQTKTDVCHAHGDGSFDLINIADPAVESHIEHGDARPGQEVPGMEGFVFDESCVAVPAPVIETLRGIAWTDVGENDRVYDPEVDLLIAAAYEQEDGSYTVRTNSVPVANSGGERAVFTVTEHAGLTGAFNNAGLVVNDPTDQDPRFTWFSLSFREAWTEVSQTGTARATSMTDDLTGAEGSLDNYLIGGDSPSLPDGLAGLEFDEDVPSTGDDTFVQVELFRVTP